MPRRPGNRRRGEPARRRHRFFLNPHRNRKFGHCPVCAARMPARAFALVITLDQGRLLLMNLPCAYCRACDLIIAHKHELESALTDATGEAARGSARQGYSVAGTLDENDWMEGSRGAFGPREIKERLYAFKDVWHFDADWMGPLRGSQ